MIISRNGFKVELDEDLLKAIIRTRQLCGSDLESGGLILGRKITNKNTIVIDKFTFPQKNDRRAKYRFYRSPDHLTIAQDYWLEANEVGLILGTWHTHPEKDPLPSAIDINDWEKVVKTNKNQPNFFLFIIVGQDKLNIWLTTKKFKLNKYEMKI